MHLTPMPSALLARRLRSSLWCQKQVGAGHMRALYWTSLFVASLTTASTQVTDYRMFIDAPGPGYRKMAGAVEPVRGRAVSAQTILSFQPKEISTATLMPSDAAQRQIQLTFHPDSVHRIREFIEFNKEKPIRVEIGDYTLPLDVKKTLPWTTGVWLEARPNEKATIILESLRQKK
jgi:hypothetical protein